MFEIGDKVVCVNNRKILDTLIDVEFGKTYIVSQTEDESFIIQVKSLDCGPGMSLYSYRFVPLNSILGELFSEL